MKGLLGSLIFYVVCIGALSAQPQSDSIAKLPAQSFVLDLKNNFMYLEWRAANLPNSYWKVQAGKNRKQFFTIGLAMGEDPREKNLFKYKHPLVSIERRFVFIRIQQVLVSKVIFSSESKSLLKKL